MSDLVAYVDGSSHGNPGRSGIGVVIESPGGEKTRIAKSIMHQDNNVAEYVALARGPAARHRGQRREASCLFGFRNRRQTNDGRVCVPEPASAFPELDLSQTGVFG